MGLFSDLKILLSRPIQAPPPAAKGRRSTAAETGEPVTEIELERALQNVVSQRLAALEAISSADDRREALLMQDGSDEMIFALGREVDAASLLLERLDRLEPELRNRLLELRDAGRSARWLELRTMYLEAGQKHLDDLRRTRLDRSACDTAVQAVLSEFPDSDVLLPKFPFISDATIADFEAELLRFARIGYDPRPSAAVPPSLQDRMNRPGYDREAEAAMWGIAAVQGGAETVSIKLRRGFQASDGTWLKIGDIIKITGDEAQRLVHSGRAVFVDEETH